MYVVKEMTSSYIDKFSWVIICMVHNNHYISRRGGRVVIDLHYCMLNGSSAVMLMYVSMCVLFANQ